MSKMFPPRSDPDFWLPVLDNGFESCECWDYDWRHDEIIDAAREIGCKFPREHSRTSLAFAYYRRYGHHLRCPINLAYRYDRDVHAFVDAISGGPPDDRAVRLSPHEIRHVDQMLRRGDLIRSFVGGGWIYSLSKGRSK